MRIEPTQPTFGLNTQRVIRYDTPYCKRIIDTVNLQNGKTLTISKHFERDNLTQKLYYLKNQAGEWIKSKLKMYKGNSVNQVLQSNRLDSFL